MGYIDEHLGPGEKVIYRTRLHPLYLVRPALLILPAVACLAVDELQGLGMMLFVTALLATGVRLVAFMTNEYGLTTSRVVVKTGWLSRRTIELQLDKLEGVQVLQPALGRVFDYGTVTFGGTGGTKESFTYVRAPIVLRKRVQEEIGTARQASSHGHNEPAYGRSPSGATSGVSTRHERACPYCAEQILVGAVVCKHCQRDVSPVSGAPLGGTVPAFSGT